MEKLIPLTEQHVNYLSKNLREWDKKELMAFRKRSIKSALRELIGDGMVWVSPKGNPCVVCGLVPHKDMEGVGVPYLLATEEFYDYGHKFAKESRLWIDDALNKYEVLYNMVAAQNVRAVRWLKWLGFWFDKETEPMGRLNLTFYPFFARRKHV